MFHLSCCPLLMTPLVRDDIRQEVKERTTNRLWVLLWIYWGKEMAFGGIMGSWGWCGWVTCSPACSPPLRLRRLSAPSVWLMVTGNKSGSVVLRSHRGGNTEKGEKWGGNSVWRENTALCQSFTAQVMTKWPCVMIGPYGLFCLAASSSEVMMASETEEVKWCDALSARLCREHELSVNLLLHSFKLYSELLWDTSQALNSIPTMHLSCIYSEILLYAVYTESFRLTLSYLG